MVHVRLLLESLGLADLGLSIWIVLSVEIGLSIEWYSGLLLAYLS